MKPHFRSPEEINRMRRIADACDYDRERIARALYVDATTVTKYARRGWIAPDGQTLLQAYARRAAERVLDAMRAHDGSMARAADALGITRAAANSRLTRAGLSARRDAPRHTLRCVECGGEFQTRVRHKRVCSLECRKTLSARIHRRAHRVRHGLDPHAVYERQAAGVQYRAALIECCGRARRAAQMLGVRARTIEGWIARNRMQDFVAAQRAREREPQYILEALAQNDWHIGRTAAAIGRGRGWMRAALRKAGQEHLIDSRPCAECGRMFDRAGKPWAVCSAECDRARNRRQKAESLARKAQGVRP